MAPNLLAPPTPNVAVHVGFASLDSVNLQVEFEKRAVVTRSVPRILQGPHSDVHRPAEVFSLQTSSLCFEEDTGVEALRLVATDVVLPLTTEGLVSEQRLKERLSVGDDRSCSKDMAEEASKRGRRKEQGDEVERTSLPGRLTSSTRRVAGWLADPPGS